MRRRRLSRPALATLLALHLGAALAPLLSPYPYAQQNRDLPYAPPTKVRFVDASGDLHGRPFVYRMVPAAAGGYEEDRSRPFPIRFLAAGETYRFGPLTLRRRLLGVDDPARLFLLGSDGFGRDLFSRLLHGARASLFSGLLATSLALGLGVAVGSISGYFGGRADAVLMRLSELFMALPWLYLLLGVRAFLPLEVSPLRAFTMLVAVIGCLGWARPARLIRGVALSGRERDFVRAARGFGASDRYLLLRHVLPQARGVILTQGALLVPRYILAEVTLSFLGLGIGEPVPSWGNMLAELQRYHVLASGWWWMALPGLVLMVAVFAYHALARGLQADARISGA